MKSEPTSNTKRGCGFWFDPYPWREGGHAAYFVIESKWGRSVGIPKDLVDEKARDIAGFDRGEQAE